MNYKDIDTAILSAVRYGKWPQRINEPTQGETVLYTARPRDQTEENPKVTRLVSCHDIGIVCEKYPEHEVELCPDELRDELLAAHVRIETL